MASLKNVWWKYCDMSYHHKVNNFITLMYFHLSCISRVVIICNIITIIQVWKQGSKHRIQKEQQNMLKFLLVKQLPREKYLTET